MKCSTKIVNFHFIKKVIHFPKQQQQKSEREKEKKSRHRREQRKRAIEMCVLQVFT